MNEETIQYLIQEYKNQERLRQEAKDGKYQFTEIHHRGRLVQILRLFEHLGIEDRLEKK